MPLSKNAIDDPVLLSQVRSLIRNGASEDAIGGYIQDYKRSGRTELITPEMASTPDPETAAQTQRTIYDYPGREMSTITGEYVPTGEEKIQAGKEMAAGMVRYVPPVAAGFATAGMSTIPTLILEALVAAGSEVTARHIAQTESDPELDTLWENLKLGGEVAALDVGINAVTLGLGSAFRKIGGKIFIPSEIPEEIRIAQKTLGEIEPESLPKMQRFRSWMKGKPSTRPFSLTFGQINGEESRFINWLEGMARAGIFSRGAMNKFDVRNRKQVIQMIKKYVEEQGTSRTAPEFADFARRIIGEQGQYSRFVDPASGVTVSKTGFTNAELRGEMFLPVVAYRKFLYKRFEDALNDSVDVVDGTKLWRYFRENKSKTSRNIYNQLRAEGLVAPLEPTRKTNRIITSTKIDNTINENVSNFQDLRRTNLVTGKTKDVKETTEGLKASHNVREIQTTKETETIGGLTEAELFADWASIPPAKADKIIKLINSNWTDGDTQLNNVLKHMGERIEGEFQNVIRKDDVLSTLHDAADSFFKEEISYMRNDAIESLRNVLKKKPTTVMEMLGGGTSRTNATGVYDRLINLKKALYFSSKTPRTGEALGRALSEGGLPAGSTAIEEMYEKSILRPLRYDMITKHVDRYGNFNPTGFLDELNKNAKVPEFYNEVFGSPEQVEEIKKLMTTLAVLQQPAADKNVFIQLAQAGAIGGVAGAGTQAIFSDDINLRDTGIAGAIGMGTFILMGPSQLSRTLTDTNLTRSFTDGLNAGVRSGKFSMSLRKIAEMKIASEIARENASVEAVEFYQSLGETP